MNIAVVTGASSGLGAEFVKEIIKARPEIEEIWVIARRLDRLKGLSAALGEKIVPIGMDITNEADIDNYKQMLSDKNADVKLLINNAGFGKLGNFCELSADINAAMVRLNCEALTVMSAVTLPFMTEGSEIINSCSIASFAPNARMAVYSSTKAYVMSLSKAMRFELKNKKINVLAVCPGPMDTEFLAVADIPKGASKTFDTLPRVNPVSVASNSLKASKKKKAVYTDMAFYKFYRILAKILPHSIVMLFCKA